MCPISLSARPKTHLSIGLWEKILEDCSNNGHIVARAYHIGEPLLWKHFEEGMNAWRASGLSRYGWISTNGLLLDRSKIEIIKRTPLQVFKICLDSLRPDVYKALRNNNHHNKVISNIKLILDRAPEIPLHVELMKTSLNADEKPDEIYEFFGTNKFTVIPKKCTNIGKEFEYTQSKSKKRGGKTCPKVFDQFCVIGSDGTAGLCCPDYDYENFLGNINHASILEMFGGEYATKMRHKIRQGDYSLAPHCAECRI
jgi:MoaA/NifB/PqqE/SkfB family radical SAM enzyme